MALSFLPPHPDKPSVPQLIDGAEGERETISSRHGRANMPSCHNAPASDVNKENTDESKTRNQTFPSCQIFLASVAKKD